MRAMCGRFSSCDMRRDLDIPGGDFAASLRDADARPWLKERPGIEVRPSPRPSPIRWEREAMGRVRASFGGPVRVCGAGFLSLQICDDKQDGIC